MPTFDHQHDIISTPMKVNSHPNAIKISVESLFNIYDKNRDGKIQRSEIKQALS